MATPKRDHVDMMIDFMDGTNMMIGASSQLIHQFNNPKWMAVRDMLNMIQDSVKQNATRPRQPI